MSAIGQLMNQDYTDRRHSFGVIPTAASSTNSSGASLQLSRAASISGSVFNRSSLSVSAKTGQSMTAGGPIRRSHSKSTLFNEDVIEVSIVRSPARKACFRAPYPREAAGVTSGEVDSYSPALKIQQVTILDDLLGRELVINVNQSHTVNYLKTRIQSRQGQDGLRIIPAHIQRLTFQGQECHDEDTVCMLPTICAQSLQPLCTLPCARIRIFSFAVRGNHLNIILLSAGLLDSARKHGPTAVRRRASRQ